MIFQHSEPGRVVRGESLLPLWPVWLVLIVFEATLWLLLAQKFRQPCTPVALAAGLTLGVAVQLFGGRGLRGAVWAVAMTLLTITLVLYAQAALHIARVLGLPPLQALADVGVDFAVLVLPGLLRTVDWIWIGAGLGLAAVFGHAWPGRRVRRPRMNGPD